MRRTFKMSSFPTIPSPPSALVLSQVAMNDASCCNQTRGQTLPRCFHVTTVNLSHLPQQLLAMQHAFKQSSIPQKLSCNSRQALGHISHLKTPVKCPTSLPNSPSPSQSHGPLPQLQGSHNKSADQLLPDVRPSGHFRSLPLHGSGLPAAHHVGWASAASTAALVGVFRPSQHPTRWPFPPLGP
jgi:hypothetical protein